MSTAVVAELTRINRVALANENALLEQAIAAGDANWQAAQEKQVARYVGRLLCQHNDLEHKRLSVHGAMKHGYKCRACKSYLLWKTEM